MYIKFELLKVKVILPINFFGMVGFSPHRDGRYYRWQRRWAKTCADLRYSGEWIVLCSQYFPFFPMIKLWAPFVLPGYYRWTSTYLIIERGLRPWVIWRGNWRKYNSVRLPVRVLRRILICQWSPRRFAGSEVDGLRVGEWRDMELWELCAC